MYFFEKNNYILSQFLVWKITSKISINFLLSPHRGLNMEFKTEKNDSAVAYRKFARVRHSPHCRVEN